MNWISVINQQIGKAVSWLTIFMVLATFSNVVWRYIFDDFSIYLSEIVIIMNALVLLLSIPYILQQDKHVRVDVLYGGFSARGKLISDTIGTLIFLLPVCALIIYFSWDYVLASWKVRESSAQTGGLPALFLVKSLIPLCFSLLFLQGLAFITQSIKELITNKTNIHSSTSHEHKEGF